MIYQQECTAEVADDRVVYLGVSHKSITVVVDIYTCIYIYIYIM